MKKLNAFALVLFLLLNCFSTKAQEEETPKKAGFITFNMTSPLLSYAPRWDVGYYRHLNERWLLGVEVGYGNYGSAINFKMDYEVIEKDYQLFEIRPEVIYIMTPNRKSKRFFSGELYYISHTDHFTTDSYEAGNYRYRFEQADYKRIKYGVNLNYGMIINFTKNFGIIPKIGFGWRFRDVKYSNQVGLVESLNGDEDEIEFPNTEGYITDSGKKSGPNFVFDVKLFFRM